MTSNRAPAIPKGTAGLRPLSASGEGGAGVTAGAAGSAAGKGGAGVVGCGSSGNASQSFSGLGGGCVSAAATPGRSRKRQPAATAMQAL